jgi:phosphate starvation-inducible protein PhoH
MIILGDNWQSDIKNSGFNKYVELFSTVDGIGYKHLDESFQLRNSMITGMYKIYKQFLDGNKNNNL